MDSDISSQRDASVCILSSVVYFCFTKSGSYEFIVWSHNVTIILSSVGDISSVSVGCTPWCNMLSVACNKLSVTKEWYLSHNAS